MKHIFLILLTIFSFNAHAKGDGVDLIFRRGYIKCATDFSIKALAHKDEDGFWQGVDADLCRYFATAIFGKDNAFELVDTKNKPLKEIIYKRDADVILGGFSGTATQEAWLKMTTPAFLYFDKLKFYVRKKEGATSMKDYMGGNVCIVMDSELNEANVRAYDAKYGLKFNFMRHKTRALAKESFILRRCNILVDNELYLRDLDVKDSRVVDEVIAPIPVHMFTSIGNYSLNVAIKWIVNAMLLAEEIGITQDNADVFVSSNDISTKNLFGVTPEVWQALGLQPNWVKKAIKNLGNYGEWFDRELGSLGIKRDKNNLIKNGGVMQGDLFL